MSKSIDPFYIVTYYIKWVTTSWTDGTFIYNAKPEIPVVELAVELKV